MLPLVTLASLALAAPAAMALRQPHEYLAALERFQDDFLNPGRVMERGGSDSLADDMVGRVDVTTTFESAELNIEYLFGLFSNIRDETSTSILGYPARQTIQTLVVEPPIVYFSAILEVDYPTLNLSVPTQVDMTTAWNDDLKMISYDAVFRRWAQTFQYIMDQVSPQIAKELNETYDPQTTDKAALMARKAATDICPTAMEYCVGENQQYESYDQCYSFLAEERQWGNGWEGGMDTTWCRYIHRNMVPFRPDVHCAHIGPSGGDMCIDRDYREVTQAFPFQQTFVALNVTWDDRDMHGLSERSIKELGKVKLTLVFPTTVAFFSVPTFVFFFLLYVGAKACEAGLSRWSRPYRKLSPANQRNTVTYLLNTFFTTVALILQLVASPVLAHEYSQRVVQAITLTAAIISALYLFEMAYRDFLRPSLLAHHICTLLAIFSLFVAIEKTYHPAIVTVGTIWLFQATTEQSIFIGLLMYRLECGARWTRRVLRFAAVQSLLCKFAFAVYLLIEHSLKLVHFTAVPTDVYFSVVVYLIGMLLLTTQVYGSWAVWAISLKLDKQVYLEEGRPSQPAAAGGGSIPPSPALSTAPTLVEWPETFEGGTDDDSEGTPRKKNLDVPHRPQ
ncbi:uncharacterized protein JCM10292_000112 [Rhodotorula paludigena]|uniref:uncharacterized protein n=1 Tax=Rhodotorula paludigena TaxID=86838 RepID=UPI0031807E6A